MHMVFKISTYSYSLIIEILRIGLHIFLGSGFCFSIKELLEPSEVIKVCVDKRNPKMAVRWDIFSQMS